MSAFAVQGKAIPCFAPPKIIESWLYDRLKGQSQIRQELSFPKQTIAKILMFSSA